MKLAVENPHRIPRFGALFGSSGGVGAKTWAGPVAAVFPEFIARDHRSAPPGAVKGVSARAGAARRRSRGHGLARLDGTGRRSTVAQVVMDEGRGRQWPLAADGADPTQAQRAGTDARPNRLTGPATPGSIESSTMTV
jgi:hypothetical protein